MCGTSEIVAKNILARVNEWQNGHDPMLEEKRNLFINITCFVSDFINNKTIVVVDARVSSVQKNQQISRQMLWAENCVSWRIKLSAYEKLWICLQVSVLSCQCHWPFSIHFRLHGFDFDAKMSSLMFFSLIFL